MRQLASNAPFNGPLLHVYWCDCSLPYIDLRELAGSESKWAYRLRLVVYIVDVSV